MKHLLPFIFALGLISLHQQASAQAIPNSDFENWFLRTVNEPDSGWVTSNSESLMQHDTLTVWKAPGVTGQAIHIQTAIVGTDTMFAFAVNSNDIGVPYTGQPSNIVGQYRYNLPGNDSAIIYVEFYKAGVVLSSNTFYIKGTGSLSTFTPFSFPLTPLTVAPDTMFIAITSSNLMSGLGIEPASWIEIDQLGFTGTTETKIPGGSFDSWTGTTNEIPVGWTTYFGAGAANVTKSTTHYWGNYSAKLVTEVGSGYTIPAILANGMNGAPYTTVNDTLSGYYMYSQTGGDSADVEAFLLSAGMPVGLNAVKLGDASTWTYFELPLVASSA